MTMIDDDLTAVRNLPPGSPTPSDESVSRTWHAITRMQAARGRRRRMPRLLVPITAGLVVVLVAVSTVVVLGQSESYTAAQPDISTVTATHQESPAERSERDPRLAVTTPEAIAALNALADTALSRPGDAITIADGQFVYTEADGWAGSQRGGDPTMQIVFQPRDIWHDPQGMLPLKLLDGKVDMFGGPRSDRDAELAHDRARLAEVGPTIYQPTPQWLDALPTDPAALLAQLRAGMPANSTWAADFSLWDMLGQLYSSTDVILSTPLRAALLRSFTRLDGLTVGEVKVDDRSLVAIRSTQGDDANAILFDPQTGKAVGRQSLFLGADMVIKQPASGPTFPAGMAYHVTWYQAVVNSLEDRN